MLSIRYENDGKATEALNALQSRMKQRVEQKVSDGSYEFEKVPCPVCDGSRFRSLAMKDRHGLYMPVVVCRDCGLVQTNPRMNRNAYETFYREEYHGLYAGEEGPTDALFRRQYNNGRQISEHLRAGGFVELSENTAVLEIGCGTGGVLQYLKELGCSVKGLDLVESYVEYGKSRHGLDLSLGTIDSCRWDKAPDLIIYRHALEHVLAPNEELSRAKGLLRDGGVLYIETPGVKSLFNGYQSDFLRFLQNAHTYHFSLTSLSDLLARNGFELLLGDETVRSVFWKARAGRRAKRRENDYLEVMAYLLEVERSGRPLAVALRAVADLRSWARAMSGDLAMLAGLVRRGLKSAVCWSLRAVGLFGPVRALYRKIRHSQ